MPTLLKPKFAFKINQSNLSLFLILIVSLSFTPSQAIDEGFIDYELKEGNGICTSGHALFLLDSFPKKSATQVVLFLLFFTFEKLV